MNKDNGNPYVSSVIDKYGDADNVRRDAETVREIQSRQGTTFLIDLIAESIGEMSNKFNLDGVERRRLIDAYPLELREAIKERV